MERKLIPFQPSIFRCFLAVLVSGRHTISTKQVAIVYLELGFIAASTIGSYITLATTGILLNKVDRECPIEFPLFSWRLKYHCNQDLSIIIPLLSANTHSKRNWYSTTWLFGCLFGFDSERNTPEESTAFDMLFFYSPVSSPKMFSAFFGYKIPLKLL